MAKATRPKKSSLLVRAVKTTAKVLVVLVLAIALFVGALIFGFFSSPKLDIPTATARSLVQRFVPDSLKIAFDDFDLSLTKYQKNFWAKTLTLDTKNFCVQYEKTAVDVCVDDLHLAVSFGWGGAEVPKEQSRLIPHIIRIEPLRILGADIGIDLPAFPEDNEPKKEGGFDFLTFARKEILPKWDVEGSRVQVRNFRIKTAPDSSFTAKFDLQPGEGDTAIEALLHEVRSVETPLLIHASVLVKRPASWGADKSDKDVSENAWKVFAEGDVRLDETQTITLKADSNITGFNKLDFRAQTFFKNISLLKEVRVEGALDNDLLSGKVSAALGSEASELRALDFVNCGVSANLADKTGGVKCGPQSVRLRVRELGTLRRPDLYVLSPELDLRITKISFDETKSADYTLSLFLDHLGMARAGVQLAGSVSLPESGVKYSSKGRIDVLVPEFKQVSNLIRRTPYSIPAPLNELDGAISLKVDVDVNEQRGGIDFIASTRLGSTYQAMNLDLKGRTSLVSVRVASENAGEPATTTLVPETDATLSILKLNLSAPRFDLRLPPAFKPDGRFGKIDRSQFLNADAAKKKVEEIARTQSKIKLRVHTVSPEAIRIATNLTKASVPISVDVVYDSASKTPSPVSGTAIVGRTPVELFRRNAHIESLKFDLLPNGDNRLNGRVSVKYLDYSINVLMLGQAADPQIRFESDPPLEDNQIIAVLLFGRPPDELGDEDQTTVGNTKAAIADAVLGISSLYLLASTPVESVGYDPSSGRVTARVGLGGGASLELGAGSQEAGTGVGFRKRISREFIFRSDVETLATTGERTVSAIIEWVRRF